MQRASDETNPSNCSAWDADFRAWKARSVSLYYTEAWQQRTNTAFRCALGFTAEVCEIIWDKEIWGEWILNANILKIKKKKKKTCIFNTIPEAQK